MGSKYESILLSEPFKFVIGPEKKQFVMHGAAVAKLSKALDKLLNGGMKESTERCIFWKDIDEKTFVRFGEWAYTGDYQAEEPAILLDATCIAIATQDSAKKPMQEPIAGCLTSFEIAKPDETTCKHCGMVYTSTIGRNCHTCRAKFYTNRCSSCGTIQFTVCSQCRSDVVEFSKRQSMIQKFNTNTAYASPTTLFKPRKNTESCEDYSEVFLSHARLYVLADTYEIPELRNLSAHKLWASLKEFTLYPKRMGDIVSLARYSFGNTMENDKLRSLVKEFCACIVEHLCKGQGFLDLLYEAPEFACDLIKEMSTRLD